MAKRKTHNLFIDMVHDNPGEAPFETKYRDPETLASLGYNGQVGKDIMTTVTFDSLGLNLFPQGSQERVWFEMKTTVCREQIAKAKAAGLNIFYHVDMFVFPQKLVDYFDDEMREGGRISLNSPRTRKMCRVLIQELFEKYPDLDGLIVRVGETYLHDCPYHTGNSAVEYNYVDNDYSKERSQFITLINLLWEKVCVKSNRTLMFRTWDCCPDRFHADPDYYLAVTDQIVPHEKLFFSVKHTALDFWRRVRFNPCLMIGKHQQIVEVQCQREYEGKGAYPMYHMAGVINGFPEVAEPKGLADIADQPLFRGVFSWSRGGGWNGPYIQNEFWINLNVEVLSQWMLDSSQNEENVFLQVIQQKGLSVENAVLFHRLCHVAQEAVLKGRYCQAYDTQYQEKIMPDENWLRDDHFGGKWQLKPIFDYLHKNDLLEEAIEEKQQACRLWDQVEGLATLIHFSDSALDNFFHVSVTYGRLLYKIVCHGWEIIAGNYQGQQCAPDHLKETVAAYNQTVSAYQKLFSENPDCPTLYQSSCRVNEYGDAIGTMSADNHMIENAEGLDHWVKRFCLGILTDYVESNGK